MSPLPKEPPHCAAVSQHRGDFAGWFVCSCSWPGATQRCAGGHHCPEVGACRSPAAFVLRQLQTALSLSQCPGGCRWRARAASSDGLRISHPHLLGCHLHRLQQWCLPRGAKHGSGGKLICRSTPLARLSKSEAKLGLLGLVLAHGGDGSCPFQRRQEHHGSHAQELHRVERLLVESAPSA